MTPIFPYKKSVRITSVCGYRINPITGSGTEHHKGIDIVGSDKNIYSPMPGTVTVAANGPSAGNQIQIETIDGHTMFFCHLASMAVKVGQKVDAGTKLGVEGATGQVTGVHLHFEVWYGKRLTGMLLDPARWIGIENKIGTYNPPEIKVDYAENVQIKCGFEQQTMDYLRGYKFADALFEKLWKAMI